MSWLMANTVAEANLAAELLSRLSKLNLQGVHNNFCEPNGMLIVNEDVKLAISKQRLKTVLLAPNAKLTSASRFCNKMRCSRSRAARISAKREVRIQPQVVPKREICFSLQEREIRIQPNVALEHDLRVSILK